MINSLIIATVFLIPPAASEPAAVVDNSSTKPIVTYQAMIQNDHLVIRARHAKGWHTYAMDNDVRAKRKLAGRPSLGVEAPTAIELKGLKILGPWLQSSPQDMSMPELRWFRWGYSDDAWFAVRLKPVSSPSEAVVRIRGQVCDDQHCHKVDVLLTLDAAVDAKPAECPLKTLIKVSTEPGQTEN